MMPTGSRVKLTYEDFLLFPDDGKRHELVDGEHYVAPCPNTKHQQIVGNLYFALRSRTRKRDETIKRRLYQRSGVSEYWIVEPELDVVRIYRPDNGFERPQELSREAGDVLTTPLLPGLDLRLVDIFKE